MFSTLHRTFPLPLRTRLASESKNNRQAASLQKGLIVDNGGGTSIVYGFIFWCRYLL